MTSASDPVRDEPVRGGVVPGGRAARAELNRDRRAERFLLWKGVFAILVVALVAYLRYRYFL